ncbi:DNA gyrase inhibitor YacG [Legionella spiritensis]|uniref:DNA gyrase inhibitor YacG n=1 Tax=Legionella spiritensis TaxID=452 RepID=UPI000F832525|nr:DNA gyrase inhibitor YacG [Legionella spiritensis]
MSNQSKIKCPICDKPNTWHPDNAFRPFCSDRCKLIDLGEWASETRRISGDTVDPLQGDHASDETFADSMA